MTGTLHEDQYTFMIMSRSFFLDKEMFQTKVVEKIKIHIVFFFRTSYRLWENVEKLAHPDRLQTTV